MTGGGNLTELSQMPLSERVRNMLPQAIALLRSEAKSIDDTIASLERLRALRNVPEETHEAALTAPSPSHRRRRQKPDARTAPPSESNDAHSAA